MKKIRIQELNGMKLVQKVRTFYRLFKNIKIFYFNVQKELKKMTQKQDRNTSNNKEIKITDKLQNSLVKSQKRLECELKLSKKQKTTILRYLSKDFAYDLSQYMEKRAIKFETEVGMDGYGWNVLHMSVKLNALECIEYILKQFYHQYSDEFKKYISLQTAQGYTPAMIAILYQSNDALNTLIKYGAVQMGIIDNKKITAYEVALNTKNQKAIRLLMTYQQQSRKQKLLNKQRLQQPIVFSKRQEGCCYRSFVTMFDFLSFGFYNKVINQQPKVLSSSPRRPSFLSFDSFLGEQQVKISRQISRQAQYDVEWKDIATIITNLKYPLYENYNPFDIAQKNIVLKNNLILFQCLSSHTWLIRKIVQIDRSKQNNFNINLFIGFEQKKISINNLIPFLKDRQQPMFIQNHNQMWPMLLQKGLAKAHGSYFDLDQLQPTVLVQELTGFPTFQICFEHFQNSQIFTLLKQIHKKGYFYLLQGNQGSNLSNQGKKDCFSVLQFFQKNDKKLVLLNCPFVDQAWKQKQKYEMHSLKLIKSHFNNYDQMCVWVEMDRLKEYFSKIIVSTVLPNYERKSLKAKVKNDFFFTFKVNREREEKIMFQLINLDTKTTVPIEGIKGYINEGSQMVNFEKGIQGQEFTTGVFSTQNNVGEYMCCINIDKSSESVFSQQNVAQSIINSETEKKHQKYMLIMWSVDGLQPQYLDESLGPVDFLRWIMVHSMKNWAESQIYRLQVASDYALILNKERGTSSHSYLELDIEKNDLIEGNLIEKKIQMSRYQDEDPFFNSFYYCIVRNANKYGLNKKSSYIKDPQNMGPAGEISLQPKLRFLTQ